MSFYTSLTGLNGAQADIAAISNNIANVSTTGFKRSRAEFGDIFATSPLQAASSAVGSGTILKSIKQQFTQGNIQSSLNALDLAISGQGFFALKPSLTSTQTVYTRDGSFSVNNDRYVVDAQGQLLQVFPVNADGSVIATGINSAKNLQLPTTSGLPKASQTIQLGLNLPADATIIPATSTYTASNPYVFDKTNPATYNQSTSITIYDSLGNSTIATIYYVKTSNATEVSPTNKWQTHVFVGDREVTPQLITAKDDQSKTYYINKFGQITTDPQSVDPTFNATAAHPLYKQDDQTNKTASTAASIVGTIMKASGFDFGDTDATKVSIITDPARFDQTREGGQVGANPPYWGADMFSISVDGSAPQSISINAGSYTGTQLAAEMTRAVNEKFGGQHYFAITDTYRKDGGTIVPGNDIIQLNLSRLDENGSSISMTNPIEIDLLGNSGSGGTPPVAGITTAENKLQLTRNDLVSTAQNKLNDALNARHLEFGKSSSWPYDQPSPPIVVGYDVANRALTFTVTPNQMGPDANEPESRFNSIQVFNPTDVINDLGIPTKTTSTDTLIRANTLWTGSAALPGGDPIVDPREQRTGIQVSYNKDTRQFSFASGSTGESSSITVGRAVLAGSPDVQAQIDSYDLSTTDFSKPLTVNLEVGGRSLAYNYIPSALNLANDPRAFFAGIQQAMPVSFSAPMQTAAGTSTAKESQAFEVFGQIMDGDAFNINLTPNSTLGQQPIDLKVGPITVAAGASTSQRLDTLKAAINLAITNWNTVAGNPQIRGSVSASANAFSFNYDTNGTIGSTLSITQTIRGSDSGLASYAMTDVTNVTGIPDITDGTTTTPTIQAIAIQSKNGLTPNLSAGDSYRITLPLADGTITTKDITLTSGSMNDLVAKLNAKAGLEAAHFSASGNNLIVTYAANGHVTGKIAMGQIGVGAAKSIPFSTLSSANTATTTTTDGTSGTPEVQSVMLSDAAMAGDNATFTVSVPQLTGVAKSFTIAKHASDSMSDIADALNTAATAASAGVTFSVATSGDLEATYAANGSVAANVANSTAASKLISFSMKVAATNTATTTTVAGGSTTKEVQTIVFSPGTSAMVAGDVFSITVPQLTGPAITITGIKSLGDNLSDLANSLNTSGATGAIFSVVGGNLVATYNTNGSVAANAVNSTAASKLISITQTSVGSTSSVRVRPENIGPLTIGQSVKNNYAMEVIGNPNGSAFRLNLRINGVVRSMSPMGAQNSTSINGLMIGNAKSVSYLDSNDLLGIGAKYSAQQIFVAGTGLSSTAATAVGTRGVTPMIQTFMLNEALGENRMTFTVDGIVGTVSLPIRAYTGDTFASAIQDRVNQIEDPKTGRIVSGVTVKFDADNNRLVFTSGTTGSNSQINVVGHANFGLANVIQTPGTVPIITNLKQATDAQGNKLYVDQSGAITTQAPSSEQHWFPLYLQEGQLTFDTVGKLISPKEGVVYSPFDPQNGSDLLRLNIDYGKFSTQYSSPFSVLSLSQDGYPSGSLNGLDIDASGTIRANYTNGQTAALGKIMVANFANANGLKQVGNADYVATSVSGNAVLGQAGADGFGTIKAGALERSNVDITEELVNLITAQRNFQANAKAIETTTTLSQTIIQIRG